MKYKTVVSGIFRKRPNRFIAHVEIDGKEEICHVKNTGRCCGLLVPDCTVYCSVSDNPRRKTKFDLVAVEKKTEKGLHKMQLLKLHFVTAPSVFMHATTILLPM